MISRLFRALIILLFTASCQADAFPTPSAVPSATVTPRVLATLLPTAEPGSVRSPTPTLTEMPPATATPPATAPPMVFTPSAEQPRSRIGESVEGRPIFAHRFGDGPRSMVLVGGVHGGWEANTVQLMEALIQHFEQTPDDVLTGIALVIVPAMNPDGVARGADLDGRFNANEVDLNRNWSCGWSADAVWREGPVNPGRAALSEPETQAVAGLIRDLDPEVALFYHSAANGVFAGDCSQRIGEWRSGPMSAIYGGAAGYGFGEPFTAYPVTGTAASWADGLGIAAADVELASPRNVEFDRNLRAIMAVQCWVLGPAASLRDACL